MKKKPLAIVLGGGYGGVRAALDLLKTKTTRVILIDRHPYHALPTQFYEVATLFSKEDTPLSWETFHQYFYAAAIPLREIFKRYPDCELIESEVLRVIPEENLVMLAGGRKIHYDWLVTALGSKTNYFDVPHLEANAFGFKRVEEALNIRNRIDELFLNAAKHKHISVVIAGAGTTGCELVAETVGYMHKLSRVHGRPAGAWSCVLVEASDTVLGASHPWIQKKAHARLVHLGVSVLLESPITDVWPNLIQIGREKKPLPYDMLVWTAGVHGVCTGDIFEETVPHVKNCLLPNAYLQIEPWQNVFAVGDVAASVDAKKKTPIPMTAQKAIHEGQYAARIIAHLVRGGDRATFPRYQPAEIGYIIPLGGKYALLQRGRFLGGGFWVWCLKYAVIFGYVASITSYSRACKYILRALRLFVQNDESLITARRYAYNKMQKQKVTKHNQ